MTFYIKILPKEKNTTQAINLNIQKSNFLVAFLRKVFTFFLTLGFAKCYNKIDLHVDTHN